MFNPCSTCINNLRNKLFEIKSHMNMISYFNLQKFVKKISYDMYNIDSNIHFKSEYNIEHIVPASIFSVGFVNKNHVVLDKEPYHDIHILFPTLKNINTLRSNYSYDNLNILNSTACLTEKNVIIKNEGFVDDFNEFAKEKKIFGKDIIDPDINYNDAICVDNEKSKIESKYDSGEYEEFKICKLGECIFSPPVEYRGDIARCIFYFYLMYAYDPSVRPYTNTLEWLQSGFKNKECRSLKGWDEFFKKELFLDWSKREIKDRETEKNKKIIEFFGVPNIFIGYYDNGIYVKSNINMIEELFYGKIHDHDKYLNIKFISDDVKETFESNKAIVKSKIEHFSRFHCNLKQIEIVTGGYKSKYSKYVSKINAILKN